MRELEGRKPQAGDFGLAEDHLQQVAKVQRGREFLSPGAEMNAGQDDLIGSGFAQAVSLQGGTHIGQYINYRTTAPRATGEGRHAESAAVVAPILDFNKSARAQAGSWQGGGGERGQRA